MRFYLMIFCLMLLCVALTPKYSLAVSECTGQVIRVWTGDNGHVWLILDNGIAAYTLPTDPDTKNILAVSTIALITGRTITVRFTENSVSCDSATNPHNDVEGVWLDN